MSELGFMLSARPRRLPVDRYAVLASQVRCGTGFTHARHGLLYVAPPAASCAKAVAIAVEPNPFQPPAPTLALGSGTKARRATQMLALLHEVADAKAALPDPDELMQRVGDLPMLCNETALGSATLRYLADVSAIAMEVRGSGPGRGSSRRITLLDGRVIQSAGW